MIPFKIERKLGLIITSVDRKETLIRKTKKIKNFSTNLYFPLLRMKIAIKEIIATQYF
jgi:hypothetical protein